MKKLAVTMTLFLLAACRGEEVPRDYQNMPPAVSHPVDNPDQAPSKRIDIGQPEPSSGAEGTTAPYEPVQPAATTSPSPSPTASPAATAT